MYELTWFADTRGCFSFPESDGATFYGRFAGNVSQFCIALLTMVLRHTLRELTDPLDVRSLK